MFLLESGVTHDQVNQKQSQPDKEGWSKVKTKNRYEALSTNEEEESTDIPESVMTLTDGLDDGNEVFHVSSKQGAWVKEEGVVDSGAVDCVMNKNRFPHLAIEPTPESMRGDTWSCAGGKKIPKEGQIKISWKTSMGSPKKSQFKIGNVSTTLVSVSRLNETGHDVNLTGDNPTITNKKTGEVIKIRKCKGMFILDMWVWVPAGEQKDADGDVCMGTGGNKKKAPIFIRQG